MTSTSLTIEEMRSALPPSLRKGVTDASLQNINATVSDPETHERYRENLLGFATVMREGRFKFDSYVNAVRYVSYKLMSKTNEESYALTFISKMQRFAAEGKGKKEISSYVHAYHHSKLVTILLEQSITPTWIVNQDLHQQALNVLADLMVTANSEKVRSDSADKLLTHLKQPETQKVEIDIGIKKDSSIDALRQATQALVAQSREALAAGQVTAQEIAEQPVLIEGTSERID